MITLDVCVCVIRCTRTPSYELVIKFVFELANFESEHLIGQSYEYSVPRGVKGGHNPHNFIHDELQPSLFNFLKVQTSSSTD